MTASHSSTEIDAMIGSVEANLAAYPGYAELCNKLGLLYALQNHFQEARIQFHRCLSLNPFDLEARMNLALLSIHQGSWTEAEAALRKYLEIEPESGLGNHMFGVLLMILGDRSAAGDRFETAARCDSFYRLQYEKLGVLRDGRIHLEGAGEKKLVRKGKDLFRVHLHHFIGECLVEMGDTGKAIREFRKATRIDADDYRAYFKIGKLYDLQGKYEKALVEFKKAVRIFPGSSMAHAYMSYAYAALGYFEKALELLEKAVEIDPSRAELRYQLGVLYEDLGMHGEAIDQMKGALAINPKYLFARINLGVLYEQTGQTDKALEQYEMVADLVTEDRDLVDRIDQLKKESGFFSPGLG